MDEADTADMAQGFALVDALSRRAPAGPPATGFCLYCGEPLEPAVRFCPGTGCAHEWEYEAQRKAANGS